MKLLFCADCGDIQGLVVERAVVCKCGRCWAEWIDGPRGIARFGGRFNNRVFGIGLHNALLQPMIERSELPSATHEYLLWKVADRSLFKQKQSMVVVFRPGDTSDTSFDADWIVP